MLAGPKPRSARNVASSVTLRWRRSTCTTRSPRRHCPRSLSGRHDAHLVDLRRRTGARPWPARRRPRTRASTRPRRPARARPSSTGSNCARSSGGTPSSLLYAGNRSLRNDRIGLSNATAMWVTAFAGVVQQRQQRRRRRRRSPSRPTRRGRCDRDAARSARDTARTFRRPGAGACRLRHARSNSKHLGRLAARRSPGAPAPLTAAASPAASCSLAQRDRAARDVHPRVARRPQIVNHRARRHPAARRTAPRPGGSSPSRRARRATRPAAACPCARPPGTPSARSPA